MGRRSLVVLGTRPEAVKLGPVVRALQQRDPDAVQVCVTGQHRDLVEPVLAAQGIRPTHRRHVHRVATSLSAQLGRVMEDVAQIVREVRPDWVVVQGDTTSALGGALGAVHGRSRVAHVEAGLRTGTLDSPWPEEAYRRMITPLADVHFAPTARAAQALAAEGVAAARVVVTGNPGIDSLHAVMRDLDTPARQREMDARFGWMDASMRWVLVTAHRRENQGPRLATLCAGLRALLAERPEVGVVWPVHPSPAVRGPVWAELGAQAGRRLRLLDPVDHGAFVHLLRRATVVVTDSGGVQEEAPTVGCPALVMREVTERPEAVEAGAARLVAPGAVGIEVVRLLDDPRALAGMGGRRALFGDGRASERIAQWLWASPQGQSAAARRTARA